MVDKAKYPGIRVTTNGNQLVAYHTEARLTDGGVFFPITPSTEMGENYQLSFAEGNLNVFGGSTLAIEAEGEHAAQGGATALSVTGRRVVNFTSGQGLPYAAEQYYHAPGKLSTMVVEVAARALTKHALNAYLALSISFGNEFIVSEIQIIGNEITKQYIIQREIQHQQNVPLDSTVAGEDRNRIENLGIFSMVEWQGLPLEDGTIILQFIVLESWRFLPGLIPFY